MNILFLANHLNNGGVTRYLLTLSQELRRAGHNVHVVSRGGRKEQMFTDLGVVCHTLNIRTKSFLHPKIYRAIVPCQRIVRDHQIDIIHSQTRITQVIGQILSLVTKKPYLSTCHGFFRVSWFRKITTPWGQKVIAISEAVQQHLENDFGVNEKRIALIENGIDLTLFIPVDEETKRHLRRSHHLEERPTIGIISRLASIKGQDVLIRSMERVCKKWPDAQLLIVGEGKTERELKMLVSRLHLEKNIYFYPTVDRAFAAQMLTMLDIFVLPSRQEGLGLALMEAQACGLPVVASGVGGILSLIQDGKTGILVKPEDVEELSQAIIKLIENKSLARSLGQAASDHAHQHYSCEIMGRKTMGLYEQFVKKSGV